MADRVATGFAAIDRAIGGGLPFGGSVLLQGPTGPETLRVALAFVAEGLREGSGGLVVVVSQRAEWVLGELRRLGVDLDRVLAERRLRIVVRPGGRDHPPAEAGQKVDVPSRLETAKLNVTIGHAITVLGGTGSKRAAIELLTAITEVLGPAPANVFARTAKSKLERLQATSLFVLEKEWHSESHLATLRETFDGVLDLEVSAEGDVTVCTARILSMKGTTPDPSLRLLDFPRREPPAVPGGLRPRPRAPGQARPTKVPCPVCEADIGMMAPTCSVCGLRFVHRPAAEEPPGRPAHQGPVGTAPEQPRSDAAALRPAEGPLPSVSPIERRGAPQRTPSAQGLTNGLILERVPPRPAGLTNGTRQGRTNGVSSGVGRTNGLTNGIGRTNGLTNGTGRTNGLAAGGRAHGPASAGFRKTVRKNAWMLYLVPLTAAAILVAVLMYVPEYHGPARPVSIDGQFGDWAAVPRFAVSTSPSLNPNVDIAQVALTDNMDFLSFYIEVRGAALEGGGAVSRTTDAFFVLLDIDRFWTTGYQIQGLGADRLIQVNGWSGQAVSATLFEFDANRDSNDWGGWFKPAAAAAAAAGGRVEMQASWSGLVDPKAPVEAVFASRSWDGHSDVADRVVTSETPYVLVSQDTRAPLIASGTQTTIAEIRLAAVGGDVSIASLNLTLDGTFTPSTLASVALVDGAGVTQAQAPVLGRTLSFTFPSLVIPDSGTVTLSVRPVVALSDGTTLGAFLASIRDVVASGGVAMLGSAQVSATKAYAGIVPGEARVDGAFADWLNVSSDPTGDVWPVGFGDLDISRYGFQSSLGGTQFLVESAGAVLNGTLVATENPLFTGSPTPTADLDRDGVPDSLDPFPQDFDNDGTPDAATSGDYDGDGLLDYGYGGGVDVWLNTTIPMSFPAPYGGRSVSVYIGPVQRPLARGEDTARFYLDWDGAVLSGYQVGGIGADYLIEVAGKEGVVLSALAQQFNGTTPGEWSWIPMGPAAAALDRSRLEASLPAVVPTNVSRGFLEMRGWRSLRDDTAPVGPSLTMAATAYSGLAPRATSGSPGDVQTYDIPGNLKWFFTSGATTGTGCTTNLAASNTPGAAPTSSTLTGAASSICWFTPTNPTDTIAGPWEVILDISSVTDGSKSLAPDANGDSNAWTAVGCTQANAWQCVDESPNDGDTTHIVSTATAVTDSLFNILDWTTAPVPPSPLAILNVAVEASCRRTGNPAVDVRILVKSGSTTSIGTTAPACANSAAYTTWTDTWTTDPSDGLPWTLADVNGLQVGIRDNDALNREVRASHFVATVSWVPVYSVQIDKCSTASCATFTTLYGPTYGNSYGADVTVTTPSIPAQNFIGNERIRFQVVLYVSGASNPGSVLIQYNGPYPGASDSRATVALPEFEEILLPVAAIVIGVPVLRTVSRRRRGIAKAESRDR